MARRWAMVFAVAGVLVGSLVAWVVASRLAQVAVESAVRGGPETVPVVIATRPIPMGASISLQDVERVYVPREMLPVEPDPEHPEAVRVAPVFAERDAVVGQVVRERVLGGEIVRPPRLVDLEAGQGLSAVLPPEMRAMAVALGDAGALRGLLEPGQIVDVLVTWADAQGRPRTTTVLQALPVLATGNRARQGIEAAWEGLDLKAVTLLVHPRQAETLARASLLGDVSLALRKPDNVDFTLTPGVEWRPTPPVPKPIVYPQGPPTQDPEGAATGQIVVIKGPVVRVVEYPLGDDADAPATAR